MYYAYHIIYLKINSLNQSHVMKIGVILVINHLDYRAIRHDFLSLSLFYSFLFRALFVRLLNVLKCP